MSVKDKIFYALLAMVIVAVCYYPAHANVPNADNNMLKSTYVGPNITIASNEEDGLEACKKAHVLGAYAMYDKMMPPEVLAIALREAKDEQHCFGHAAKGDDNGNHEFSCWGITWPGGSNENLAQLCDETYQESKQKYLEWLKSGNYQPDAI